MIANLRGFDLQTNSPCQYQKKHMQKSMENVDTDVRGVNGLKRRHLLKMESFGLLIISRLIGELLPHQAHTVSRQDNKNKFVRDRGVERWAEGSEEDPTFDPLSHSRSAFEPNFLVLTDKALLFNAALWSTKRQPTTDYCSLEMSIKCNLFLVFPYN